MTRNMLLVSALLLCAQAHMVLGGPPLSSNENLPFEPTHMFHDDELNNHAEWLDRPAFEFEGHRRRSQRRVDLVGSAAVNDVNKALASGVAISASPLTIAHGGAVTITITNNGASVAPALTDWIACYTPSNTDITKTVPVRYQIANWTGTWGTGSCSSETPCKTTMTFKLNNFHTTDYACYLFNGGLALNDGALKTTIKVKSEITAPSTDISVAPGAKPFLSVLKNNATAANPAGGVLDFRVLAGPTSPIVFDKPNLPTHVRVTPGTKIGSFTFSWNQNKESTGGKLVITRKKGDYAGTTPITAPAVSSFVLDMSKDVCAGGPAGSTWGFRDMAKTYQAIDVDLTSFAGCTIYYKVGDASIDSSEYNFYVPAPSGWTKKIKFIAYADQGVGYDDDSFSGRDFNNGYNALGVAKGVIKDVATGEYSAVVIGGDITYSDGYLTMWEDWFDMMEAAIASVPTIIGEGNHESAWFNSDGVWGPACDAATKACFGAGLKTNFCATASNLCPPRGVLDTGCVNVSGTCPMTGTFTGVTGSTFTCTSTGSSNCVNANLWPTVRRVLAAGGANKTQGVCDTVNVDVCTDSVKKFELGYVGPGWSQWSGSSSGGECGLAYKLMPQPGTTFAAAGSDKVNNDVTWFSVAYGPVTFVHYSTERDMSEVSPQYKWLVDMLPKIDRTKTPFIFAIGHRATYVDFKSTKDIDIMLYYQTKLDKLFRDNKVTVVMSGHTHVTQRHGVNYQGSKIMNATVVDGKSMYTNPTAPVFLSVGFAGAGGDLPTPGQAGADFTDWRSTRPAYTRVSVDTDKMTVEYVDALTLLVLDTSVITITLPSGAYANFKEDACAASTTMTVAPKDSKFFVTFSVTLPYTKTEFDTDKQTVYKKAVAKAAGTILDNVDIVVTDARRRAGSVTVETKVRATDAAGQAALTTTLGTGDAFKNKLNAELKALGLKEASAVTNPTQAGILGSTATRSYATWMLLAAATCAHLALLL